MSDDTTDGTMETLDSLVDREGESELSEIQSKLMASQHALLSLTETQSAFAKFISDYKFDNYPRGRYDAAPEKPTYFEDAFMSMADTLSGEIRDVLRNITRCREKLLSIEPAEKASNNV